MEEEPELPVLRVFAAFEETVTWPAMDPGSMGNYPLARLSSAFMDQTCEVFPSFKNAANKAKALNA